jgi:hypothetical protein
MEAAKPGTPIQQTNGPPGMRISGGLFFWVCLFTS